jgi:hypothetical protein
MPFAPPSATGLRCPVRADRTAEGWSGVGAASDNRLSEPPLPQLLDTHLGASDQERSGAADWEHWGWRAGPTPPPERAAPADAWTGAGVGRPTGPIEACSQVRCPPSAAGVRAASGASLGAPWPRAVASGMNLGG